MGKDMLRLVGEFFVIIGLGLLFVLAVCSCGCETQRPHDIKVHHDDQRMDIYIHRDRKRHQNAPPKQ
jgi:hypothetical protein